jgi:hypothetical protein
LETLLMNAMVCRDGFFRSITVAVFATGLFAAFASSASAACPSPLTLKISGVRWPDGRAASQPSAIQAAYIFPEREPTIAGLWKVDFLIDGQVVDQGFDAWHADGTETLNDSVSPAVGNVCLGVWEQTGRRTYELKHPSWNYDGNGVAIGIVIIHELITLDRSGNGYRGKVNVEVLDLDENTLASVAGEITGKRITVN